MFHSDIVRGPDLLTTEGKEKKKNWKGKYKKAGMELAKRKKGKKGIFYGFWNIIFAFSFSRDLK